MYIQSGTKEEQDLIVKAKRGDRSAFDQLFLKYKPMLELKANIYRKATMPLSAIQMENIKLFTQAFKKFELSKGIQFKTFLDTYIKPYRYVQSNKSPVRIPEHRALQFTHYKNVKDFLETEKDREPNAVEMADRMGWSMDQVTKMERTLNRNLLSESESQERRFGLSTHKADRFSQTVEYVYYMLTDLERKVFDYMTGTHGSPKLSVKQIAKKLRISPDKVYRLKRDVDKKIRQNTYSKTASLLIQGGNAPAEYIISLFSKKSIDNG